jgi:hypothetical protein
MTETYQLQYEWPHIKTAVRKTHGKQEAPMVVAKLLPPFGKATVEHVIHFTKVCSCLRAPIFDMKLLRSIRQLKCYCGIAQEPLACQSVGHLAIY